MNHVEIVRIPVLRNVQNARMNHSHLELIEYQQFHPAHARLVITIVRVNKFAKNVIILVKLVLMEISLITAFHVQLTQF